MNSEPCPGCKGLFTHSEGMRFRYGTSSAGCWKAFTHLQGYEHDLLQFPPEHRLTVDSYMVQHPQNIPLQKELDIDERLIAASIQSVAVHLLALYCVLEKNVPFERITHTVMPRSIERTKHPLLEPPESLGALTIADFSPKFSSHEYHTFAWNWARSAWQAWSPYHALVRHWYDLTL